MQPKRTCGNIGCSDCYPSFGDDDAAWEQMTEDAYALVAYRKRKRQQLVIVLVLAALSVGLAIGLT